MANCDVCGTKRPMLEMTPWIQEGNSLCCPSCASQKGEELSQSIAVTTGGAGVPFRALDSVFAIEGTSGGVFQGINPSAAFEGVKQQLRKQCAELGGNAVVDCQFQYRNALSGGLFGKNQSLEIFAYGTAVQTDELADDR